MGVAAAFAPSRTSRGTSAARIRRARAASGARCSAGWWGSCNGGAGPNWP